jgi:hypothetical protein
VTDAPCLPNTTAPLSDGDAHKYTNPHVHPAAHAFLVGQHATESIGLFEILMQYNALNCLPSVCSDVNNKQALASVLEKNPH